MYVMTTDMYSIMKRTVNIAMPRDDELMKKKKKKPYHKNIISKYIIGGNEVPITINVKKDEHTPHCR